MSMLLPHMSLISHFTYPSIQVRLLSKNVKENGSEIHFQMFFSRFWLQVWRLQLWGLATQGVLWSFTSWCDQLSICTTACSTLSSAQLFTSLTSTPSVSLVSPLFSPSLPAQLKCCPLFLCSAGRILNRFSKDIGLMDSKLPITFVDFYQVRKCWNVPFPQRCNAFSFNCTCVVVFFLFSPSVIFAERWRRGRGSFSHPHHARSHLSAAVVFLVLEAFLPPHISRCETSWGYK